MRGPQSVQRPTGVARIDPTTTHFESSGRDMTSIRRLLIKVGTGILFFFLIASFALWGIGDIFRGGDTTVVVAQVGDQEITEQEFSRTFRQQFEQVRQNFGGQFDMEMARQMGLVDEIVQQSIVRALFSEHADAMNMVVTDSLVAEHIRRQEAFHDAQGRFDRRLFDQLLTRAGLNESMYVNLVRDDLKRYYITSALAGGIQVPGETADGIYRYLNEQRLAEYVVLPVSRFDVEEPGDHALEEFYQANTENFMAPEYRELSVIHISADDFLDEVHVSEEDLQRAYEDRAHEFGEAEQRRLEQVLFDDEDAARAAHDALRQGRDFETVAQEHAETAPIDLGLTARDDILPQLADPVFALNEGDVTEPVESALGWHLVRVTEIQEGTDVAFEEVRDDLRRDLARHEAVNSLVSLANTLDDALAGGATVEEAARMLDLPLRRIDAVDAQGRDREGEVVEELPEGDEFLQVAFNTSEGEDSLLHETRAGDYFVLRVQSTTPSQPRPFASVREEVREAYLRDRRHEAAREAAEEMAERIQAGIGMSQVAQEHGLEVRASEPLRRGDNRAASPEAQAVAGSIFEVSQGETVVGTTEESVVVARLSEVIGAEPEENDGDLERIRQQLAQGFRNDLLDQYANALRDMHTVRINESALDRILERYY